MSLFKKTGKNSYWIALSDIMTALMLVFLLLFSLYMLKVNENSKVVNLQEQLEKSQAIPKNYKELRLNLTALLREEFKDDLSKFNAVIGDDLTIRFNKPEILFKTGEAELSKDFEKILDNFFPRYLKIITDKNIIDNIDEIRIEGHTSSVWNDASADDAYLKNMALSSKRAQSVLEYILRHSKEGDFLKKHFRAIGFASAKTLDDNSNLTSKSGLKENYLNSQRVEFRVITNIEDKLKDQK